MLPESKSKERWRDDDGYASRIGTGKIGIKMAVKAVMGKRGLNERVERVIRLMDLSESLERYNE